MARRKARGGFRALRLLSPKRRGRSTIAKDPRTHERVKSTYLGAGLWRRFWPGKNYVRIHNPRYDTYERQLFYRKPKRGR
jgi:hypothetical protein